MDVEQVQAATERLWKWADDVDYGSGGGKAAIYPDWPQESLKGDLDAVLPALAELLPLAPLAEVIALLTAHGWGSIQIDKSEHGGEWFAHAILGEDDAPNDAEISLWHHAATMGQAISDLAAALKEEG